MSELKMIFIIPYRNRYYLKQHFEIYMKYILEDIPKNSYEFFFVHQKDNKPFNRGAMKNIGFLAMRNKYPDTYKNITFIFNDIDTMPVEKNYLEYETTHNTVKHFYGFKFALGGIFSIKGADFEKVGGFPNYWAWGLEDNDIQGRVEKHKIKIDRSQFHDWNNVHIIQIPYDYKRVLSKQQSWRAGPLNTEGFADIKNLTYNIEDEFINVTNFTAKVDPTKDNYVEHRYGDAKIRKDKNFVPPDAVIQPKASRNKKNMDLGMNNFNINKFNVSKSIPNNNNNNNNKFKMF